MPRRFRSSGTTIVYCPVHKQEGNPQAGRFVLGGRVNGKRTVIEWTTDCRDNGCWDKGIVPGKER